MSNTTNMHPIENMGFLITSIFLGAVGIIAGIFNIIYYNKLRINTTNNCNISSGTATSLLIVNIILLLLAAMVFLWGFYRLFLPHDSPHNNVKKEYNTYVHEETGNVSTL